MWSFGGEWLRFGGYESKSTFATWIFLQYIIITASYSWSKPDELLWTYYEKVEMVRMRVEKARWNRSNSSLALFESSSRVCYHYNIIIIIMLGKFNEERRVILAHLMDVDADSQAHPVNVFSLRHTGITLRRGGRAAFRQCHAIVQTVNQYNDIGILDAHWSSSTPPLHRWHHLSSSISMPCQWR